ncbi:MAG: PocR ligand-binding domain-containing protein, partial [Bacilli bacterium]|nr:PocR ligand-binding domain-containing protein [Bacilli bacterium]
MNDLQSMLKDLYLISGLNISIYDIDENIITSYPEKKSPFCALIEHNPESLKHCQECDHNAFKRVKKSGKIDIYKCYFNLYEAAVPLYTYGIHTGYLMMGQTLTTSRFDREYIKEKAIQYINNEEVLEDAIKKISVHSHEQILAFSNIVDICAKYITLT